MDRIPKKLVNHSPFFKVEGRYVHASILQGRFLRFLASHHIYREIRPNVFTNTRISSMLDTHKSSSEIMAK